MRYQIRLATRADVAGILKIYAPVIQETATSFEYEVPSEDDFWRRISAVLNESAWLVCIDEDEVAGYAYASPHRSRTAYQWNRELSVYVHSNHRGKSIATGLYKTLFDIILKQGFGNALIGITLPNKASVTFHEKLGFEQIGIYRDIGFKNDTYHSVGWWQLKILQGPPGKLRWIDELSTAELEEAMIKGVSVIQTK